MGVATIQEVNGPHEDAVNAWSALARGGKYVEKINRRQIRQASAVITVTPQMADYISRDVGRPDSFVVPNGADVARFKPVLTRPKTMPPNYVILFGALAPWQGIETAMDATQEAIWPASVKLVIVGDGLMRDSVQRRVSENIVYLGSKPYRAMPEIIGGAVASLLPKSSRHHSESGLSPLKLYESMACGVPIIASDLPNLASTVKGASCGLVIPSENPTALAEAVRWLVEHPAEAKIMGINGRDASVAHHSWQQRATETAEILASVVRYQEMSTDRSPSWIDS
jgi:glycosyltransferase involved in cell wall biosynthesis